MVGTDEAANPVGGSDADLGGPEHEAGRGPLAEPAPFAGHDAGNPEYQHLAIPEIAGATALARASVDGSNQARRRARILAWVLIAAFVVPIVLGLLASAAGGF
ncbi:MAG: hypothetical protein AAFN30_06320 [Actinomycetota bacterium]